jgi:hypothetical protein
MRKVVNARVPLKSAINAGRCGAAAVVVLALLVFEPVVLSAAVTVVSVHDAPPLLAAVRPSTRMPEIVTLPPRI